MKTTLSITAAIAISVLGYVLWPDTDQPTSSQEAEVAFADKALADIVLPDTLSVNAQIGKRGFDANCATCHGTNAVGQDGIAPPLIHIIYEPSHHGDESFQRAVAMGVRGHHWPFGSMPPIEGLNRGDVTMITAYIREVQRANGIN
ncbi:cytochrome c [uncultured Tateyamaria sp.]|uniref:c-type cytochrome n=1 Tax=uncultured Tateyamaria sp. TaxID=455651 RepID=UPI0026360854|nr:cytochrome c [uncultured Tateyamaria sp.]